MRSSRRLRAVMLSSTDRGSESFGSRLAWWLAVALVMAAIVLALPNRGLGTVLREDLLGHGPVESIEGEFEGGRFTRRHGHRFSDGLLMIYHRWPGEDTATKILEVWGARGLYGDDVLTVVGEDGLVVTVAGHEDHPVAIGPSELVWLRWLGPRVVVDGIQRPLWHWLDAIDSAFLMVIALVLFELVRRLRGGSRVNTLRPSLFFLSWGSLAVPVLVSVSSRLLGMPTSDGWCDEAAWMSVWVGVAVSFVCFVSGGYRWLAWWSLTATHGWFVIGLSLIATEDSSSVTSPLTDGWRWAGVVLLAGLLLVVDKRTRRLESSSSRTRDVREVIEAVEERDADDPVSA